MKKIEINYASKVFLPNDLIQDAINDKWERSLAYYILLKQTHKKPIFYNYSLRKIAKQTGLSTSSLNRHINLLISKGLLCVVGKNLCFVGLNKLKDTYNVKTKLVAVKLDNTITQLILNIQFTRYIPNFINQQKIVDKKTEVIKFRKSEQRTTTKEAKRLLKLQSKLFGNQTNLEKSLNDYIMLSNKSFGKLANRSKYTGINIQKRLNKAGLIKSEKNSTLYSNQEHNKRAFYNLCLPSQYLHSKVKGHIYRVLPNRITILTK